MEHRDVTTLHWESQDCVFSTMLNMKRVGRSGELTTFLYSQTQIKMCLQADGLLTTKVFINAILDESYHLCAICLSWVQSQQTKFSPLSMKDTELKDMALTTILGPILPWIA